MDITHQEEKDASFLTLTNKIGFSLTLCDVGAAIYEMHWLDKPLTIAEKDRHAYLSSTAYFGKTVGRLAGRVKKGDLLYQGKHYALDTNEGGNTLHGGAQGFSFKRFPMHVNDMLGLIAVDFDLDSPDGEGGFPGAVRLIVRYTLAEQEAIVHVSFLYVPTIETPLNLTCHTYFNLGGDATIENHRLKVNADETMTYDEEMVPLGFAPSRACLDFRKEKRVGQDIKDSYLVDHKTKGYDHCFRFKENDHQKPVLTLKNAGIKMSLVTSLPCVQIYSDNYPREGSRLTNGHTESLHSGLAIEPVFAPLDYRAMTALPGKLNSEFIEYRFSKED
jgi:aldose 1-epimerase